MSAEPKADREQRRLERVLSKMREETPEQLLKRVWPYLHMSPEERDRRCQELCDATMKEWRGLSAKERARIRRKERYEKRHLYEVLRQWARECHERSQATN